SSAPSLLAARSVPDLFQVLQIFVVLVAGDLEQLVLLTIQIERVRPGPRVDERIAHCGLVANRVAIDRTEALDRALGLADDFTHLVQPRLAIEIRRLDHERVAIPAAGRIALPQSRG